MSVCRPGYEPEFARFDQPGSNQPALQHFDGHKVDFDVGEPALARIPAKVIGWTLFGEIPLDLARAGGSRLPLHLILDSSAALIPAPPIIRRHEVVVVQIKIGR